MKRSLDPEKYVLITGASGGLGFATARKLFNDGAYVILNARNSKKLEALRDKLGKDARFRSSVLIADVGDATFNAKLKSFMKKMRLSHLDVVIHSAAINHMGTTREVNFENAENTLRTNSLSVINLAQATEPFLAQSSGPRFVLVSSLMKYFAMPGRSVYAASKAAAEQFAEAWSHELRAAGSKIRVQIFRPAGIETAFHENTPTDGDAPRSDVSRMQPETVADHLVRFISSRKSQLAPGFMNRVAAFIARHFTWITRVLVQRRYRKSLQDH
jgi:uncharacterized protein